MGKLSTAGVLRLRAKSAVSSDRSVRRFAQDDGFVGGLKKNTSHRLTLIGLASWAKFSRPYGTEFGNCSSHADSLAPSWARVSRPCGTDVVIGSLATVSRRPTLSALKWDLSTVIRSTLSSQTRISAHSALSAHIFPKPTSRRRVLPFRESTVRGPGPLGSAGRFRSRRVGCGRSASLLPPPVPGPRSIAGGLVRGRFPSSVPRSWVREP
jgi:hypothetical protein